MRNSNRKSAHWQLMRERFHILNRFPPASRRDERAIGSILSDILGAEQVDESLPNVVTERWTILAGSQLAKHTKPARLSGGVLTVYADHPGWLTEIRRLPKAHLLKKLSAIPDVPDVSDIRYQLDPELRTGKFGSK